MNNIDFSDPMTVAGLIVLTVFILGYGAELLAGRIKSSKRPMRDALFTLFGMSSQAIISGTLVAAFAAMLAMKIWPDNAGALSHVSFWLAFPVIFLIEETLHYTVHRYAHEWRWLWKLHRTHHSATDLNVGVIYRYNFFWVFLLPQSWIGGFAIYFGLGWAFMAAIMVTYLVNVATHASFRWDLWLLDNVPGIKPFWWVFERVITTPDAHHAHHAYGKNAHPNGNYAVTFFLLDVIFGTAKLPRARQQNYGLPISPRLHWAEELLWPVVKKPLLPKPEKPR